MSKTLVFNFPLWFELLKTHFEKGGSAYAAKYVPLALQSGLPWISDAPRSFADWLFVIYIAGIFVFLLRRLRSYVRLRRLLSREDEPGVELRTAVERVCLRYGLKPCRVVAVPELPTAFVCGVLRPILAVPGDKAMDDKVLLHELLHLKHRDILQNVLWHCLRALHWWNIFLVPVFERIENELESLCDQRVLEHLEGSERRDYGEILLSMASEKYARAAGTSSISNGGTYVSERIENIARFKKYPRGMALVSLCIAFILALGLLGGAVRDYQGTSFTMSAYATNNRDRIERSMAVTRLIRCRTPDAAIDTYAKAMVQRNGFYLATACPLERQEAIAEELRASIEEYSAAVNVDVGPELEYMDYIGNSGYIVSEYTENPDGSVDAELQFAVSILVDSDGREIVYEYERDGSSWTERSGAVIMNVRAEERPEGWVVQETGRRCVTKNELMDYYMVYLEPSFTKTVETEHGGFTMKGLICRGMTEYETFSLFGSYDNALHLNESFRETVLMLLVYDPWERSGKTIDRDNLSFEDWPGGYISCETVRLDKASDTPEFMYEKAVETNYNSWGDGGKGYNYTSWGTSFDRRYEIEPPGRATLLSDAPWAYAVRLCWDNEIVEEVVFPLEEVMAGG